MRISVHFDSPQCSLRYSSSAVQALPRQLFSCGSHDTLAKSLNTKFKEARRAMGVVGAKAVMEIFMSPKGTWTVWVTDTTGIACVIATGQDWQEVPIAVTGLDS